MYDAHRIATKLYNKAIIKHSKEEALNVIKDALSGISYNEGRGFIVLSDINGKLILHKEKKFEGKNFSNYEYKNTHKFVETINKTIKNKSETFDRYFWYKNTDITKSYEKIGFYKYFKPLNIVIATSDFISDFEIQVQRETLHKINSIRHDNFEHIFIYDLKGLCLANPKKELIGVNRYNVKNKNGNYGLRDTLEFAEKNIEGFKRYKATVKLDETLKSNDKISFIKLNEEWNWVIGSGFYLEGLYKEIDKKEKELIKTNINDINQIIVISMFITIVFIIISFLISKYIALIFSNYKKSIQLEMDKTIEKEKLLVQQSKMATMGEMLGSIAHQWKQPLSVISLSNGLLRLNREVKDFSTEEEILKSIDDIDNSVKNLSQTIDDFRNFFNPNKERTLYKVSKALSETLKLTRSQFRNSNIELVQKIDDVELFGSQNELQQALINILKNAKEELIKKDTKDERYIFIKAYKEKENLIIKIKDNANGIPINIIDKIFNSYFTTKETKGGTGIGLYMCKQIIEGNMEGKITVFNSTYTYMDTKYKGAEFTISIPLNLSKDI